eukprot:gene4725-5173_t
MAKEEKKSKKEKKSHSHKHKKSTKEKHHSRSHDKEKSKTSRRDAAAGGGGGVGSFQPLQPEDYFLKNMEYRVWNFEDLSSEEARSLFEEEFLPAYNSASLDSFYYSGDIPLEVRKNTTSTQHRWKMHLTEQDKDRLADVTEDVDNQTRHHH